MVVANVRSLTNKFDELHAFVEEVKPAVVGITESWLNDDYSDAEFTIPGYVMYRQDRMDTHRGFGGGVLLYVKGELNSIEREDLQGNFTNSVWCEIQMGRKKNSPLIIGVVYRSPNSTRVNDGLLFDVLKAVSSKEVIIMGDFNYPDISWENGTYGSKGGEFYEVLQDCFLHQHVHFPTRGLNILDLVLSRASNMVDNVQVFGKLGTSDHEMIAFDVVGSHYVTKSSEVVPNFSRADIDGISTYFSNIDWDILFHGLCATDCWNSFLGKVNYVISNFVPVRKRQRKSQRPPWMSKDLFREIRKKRKLWRRYKLSSSNDDLTAFNDQVRLVRQQILSAKFVFEKSLASNIKENPKAFFSYVRSKQKVKDTVGPLKKSNVSSLVSDNQGMADILNDFFASVFEPEDIDMSGRTINRCHFSLDSISFSVGDVEKRLSSLNQYKTPGPDKVYPFLLKTFARFLAGPLSVIFQRSMDEGVVPADWKCANVTPIFKKGDRSHSGNYRPVSLTSVVCKIMESVIRDGLVKFLDSHALINSTQHGFQRKRSCLTNILEFLEDITSCVDSGNPVDVVFLDFQKAFDKVPHKRLLCKLEGLGVRDCLLNWIGDWLDDRKQRVVVGGSVSSWKGVTSGVPQGSVLGPLLFVAYINDLDDAVSVSKIKKFADDTKVYREVCSVSDAENFQMDLDSIFKWSRDWGMFFNVAKCKVMHIGNGNKKMVYSIDGRDLEVVQKEKDLGVYLDSSLKPSKQCVESARRANWILGLIRRHFKFLHKDVVIRLYKQMVRPHLEYAVQAWNPYLAKDRIILERVQKRATRLIRSVSSLSYEQRLRHLKLTSLELRRLRGDLIQVFKIVHGFDRLSFDNFFNLSHNNYTRGHGLKLRKDFSRLDIRKYFFSQRVVDEWNNLPESLVYANSVNIFKNGIDAYFSDNGRI